MTRPPAPEAVQLLECFAIPMRPNTKRGELRHEPFSVAAQLRRHVYGTEISPACCNVIVKR